MIKRNNLYGIVCLLSLAGYAWVYMAYHYFNASVHNINLCMIKNLTTVPCPSCGTTRSVMSILHGSLMEGFFINPLGFLILITATLFPAWVIADIILNKDSFHSFYLKAESLLKRKWLAIPLLLFIFINWIWNINKGL
jgi:hypothetical protein